MKKALVSRVWVSVTVLLSGCMGSVVTMPTNVRTRVPPGYSAPVIESIDFSASNPDSVPFGRLKVCVATNVSNDAVTLTDASGSHLSPITGLYHSEGSSHVVQARQVIKYSDDAQQTIIADGNADGGPVALGLTRDEIQYELQAAVEPSQIKLIFTNIAVAQLATGVATNDGFLPVGAWATAKPMQAYGVLEQIANRIKDCLR